MKRYYKGIEWNNYDDLLDWEMFNKPGAAKLRRWYRLGSMPIHVKESKSDTDAVPPPVIAKGILAFMSFSETREFQSCRMQMNQGLGVDWEEKEFPRYFNHCMEILRIENKISLPKNRKSDQDLIAAHLASEEQFFNQTWLLFEEVEEREKETLEAIREMAHYYLEWVRKSHGNVNNTKPDPKKDGYSSKEWCTILYFKDYTERNDTDRDIDIVKSFHTKHKLPFAKTSFLQNFKEVKRHIEKSENPAVRLIEKIIPYFSTDEDVQDYAETQLSIIKDDIERE